MCMDGLVQLLIMLAKPRTKLIRTNRNAYYTLIMLMLPKVSEPLLNRIYCINLDKNTCRISVENQPGVSLNSQVMTMDIGSEAA